MSTQTHAKEPEEVNVVVTGFAPGGLDSLPWPVQPVNASWLMAAALPRVIFRNEKPNIRVVLYPDAVWTGWEFVRKLVPKLWDGENELYRLYQDPKKPKAFRIDAMLHLGILDQPREAFRLEKYGFQGDFKLPDAGGETPTDDDKNGGGHWKGVPYRLTTDFDVGAIHKRVSSQIEDGKIVISEDPNRFLCAYIFYSSLAELYRRGEKKRVMFMHTPVEYESGDIKWDVGVVRKVIEAMVDELEADTELP